MTALNPPFAIQGEEHPAANFRGAVSSLIANKLGGVCGPGDLEVAPLDPTPGMAVTVAAGSVWIPGTTNSAEQFMYGGTNDAEVELTIAAADATNPRKDLILARLYDSNYTGGAEEWTLEVLAGTPAGVPLEPVVPASCRVLALVDVAANETEITGAEITDRRVSDARGRAAALGGTIVCTSATRPTAPSAGDRIFETDTDRSLVYRSGSWQAPRLDPPGVVVVAPNQNIANDSGVDLAFSSADLRDTDGFHNPGVNPEQIVIPSGLGGWYSISGVFNWGSSSAGRRQHLITVNASGVWAVRLPPVNAGGANIPITADLLLAAGDVLRFNSAQTSGGTLSCGATISLRRVAEA